MVCSKAYVYLVLLTYSIYIKQFVLLCFDFKACRKAAFKNCTFMLFNTFHCISDKQIERINEKGWRNVYYL